MDAIALRWTHKYARNNFWRVSRCYDIDDLVQDGWVCYVKVSKRYPGVSKLHLMSLYQITYMNHITNMVRKMRVTEGLEISLPKSYDTMDPFSDLLITIAELPEKAARAVKLLMTSGQADKPLRVKANGDKESLNDRLCRLTGLDKKKYDLPMMIRTGLK